MHCTRNSKCLQSVIGIAFGMCEETKGNHTNVGTRKKQERVETGCIVARARLPHVLTQRSIRLVCAEARWWNERWADFEH